MLCESATLDELIEELFKIKDIIRDIKRHSNNSHKKALACKKDRMLVQIKEELNRVNEDKAKEIKNRLWEELGVLI